MKATIPILLSLEAMPMQQSLFGASPVIEQPSLFNLTATSQDSPPVYLTDTPLADTTFTVMDIETTGLNPKKNAITEICAIQYKNGQQVGYFSTLVKPTEPISDEIERFTKISNDMVANAPELSRVLNELNDFVGPAPWIVGHNIPFDLKFMREKFQTVGLMSALPKFGLEYALCTCTLARKACPGLPSYQGVVVATACGIHNPNPHRAESDVRMTGSILFALIDKLSEKNPGLSTVQDLLTLQGKLS
jgi:DNA polymerase III epsilon subunit family exonuclease